jgi:hypothetical protein
MAENPFSKIWQKFTLARNDNDPYNLVETDQNEKNWYELLPATTQTEFEIAI